MRESAGALLKSGRPELVAAQLVTALRTKIPVVTRSLLEQSAQVKAAKAATRYEMLRRATLAQSFLHSILHRAVGLDELGRVVGSSPFQLLRAFQHCFGETPASYHRKLRLRTAMAEAQRRRVTIAHVSDDYGFAGASSFSHAFRRVFGHSPRNAAFELRLE
ncbi:AraC-like DNA-binding protein [Sphingomonas sp. F9_3S_D5_B_2]